MLRRLPTYPGIGLFQRRLELFQDILVLRTLEPEEPFERVQRERFNGLHRQGAGLFTGLMPSHAISHNEQIAPLVGVLRLWLR